MDTAGHELCMQKLVHQLQACDVGCAVAHDEVGGLGIGSALCTLERLLHCDARLFCGDIAHHLRDTLQGGHRLQVHGDDAGPAAFELSAENLTP